MKILLIGLGFLISVSAVAENPEFTGGIEVNEPFNLQIQMCALKDGVEQKDYDRLIQKYFDWSVKHQTEVTFIRQVPLFTHANAKNPGRYDFVEFLATDHANAGIGWDKWLSTPDGQKLNAEWQQLAHCDVKMAQTFMLWADVEQMNSDSDRMVVWNWCDRKPGITWDQMNLKHREMIENRSTDRGNIGWALFIPHFGGALAPAEFAHIVVYPDAESLMKDSGAFANGGWRAQTEYLGSYANCQGRSVNLETIMRRPGD